MKVIIVGGVAGGASCAARLRRLDEKAEILMVERGPYVSYANCGLPYHVGGSIPKESSLLVATEQTFRDIVRDRLPDELRGGRDLGRRRRPCSCKNHATGEVTTEKYDKLVLSPGAAPIRPPLPGIDLPGIFSVRTVPDARNIREWLDRGAADCSRDEFLHRLPDGDQTEARAVVVGGGFIGLEMVENLVQRGLEVTLIERLNQVMPPLDPEMARLVERYMVKHGVKLELNDGVAGFKQAAGWLAGGPHQLPARNIPADIVILAIGVKPETDAGEDGRDRARPARRHPRGRSHAHEQPGHFRRGRCHRGQGLRHRPVDAHSAGRAGQPPGPDRGRCDLRARFPLPRHAGHLDLQDVRGHRSPRPARARRSWSSSATRTSRRSTSIPNSHAGYYPGAKMLAIKVLFRKSDGRLLGAQVLGEDGVAKRIDSFAMAIQMGCTIYDLEESELSYAPPYGSAKDPVNFAGMVAADILRGDMPICHWDSVDGAFLLDVRNPPELAVESVPGAVNIPLPQLRARLGELPRDREILVICRSAQRAYYATRILLQNGFKARNISGGMLSRSHRAVD